jgi:hypothetical protein
LTHREKPVTNFALSKFNLYRSTARVLKSPITDRAGGGLGGLVAAGSFLPLRTERDVRAMVAAAAACACPAYVWLATPNPSVPAVDRGARSVELSAAAAALAAHARRDPGGAAARKQARIRKRAAEQERMQADLDALQEKLKKKRENLAARQARLGRLHGRGLSLAQTRPHV